MRTLQSGHTVIRADQFDPDGWQLLEITDLCQDNDEGCATNYVSVIAHVYQRPICKDNDVSAGDHDPASTRSCRPRQKTTFTDNGPARSHPTISPTSSPRFKSGTQMHGAFQNHEWGLAHYMVYVRCAVGARQSLTERQPGNPVEEGAERLRSSTDCDPEGRQRCDVLRTMRDVWESVAAHSPDHGSTGSRDEAEQSHSACVYREATRRNRTLLLSARTREHDDAGHAATEPLLEMLDVQYHLRNQAGSVRCSTCAPGELRGCRREHGFHWGRRNTVPLNVQGQLKGVDQEVCLLLIYETRQRPENQIATLVHTVRAPREKRREGRGEERREKKLD